MKKVAKGESSPKRDLPAFLRKDTPASMAALHQENKSKIQWLWKRCWKDSPCHQHMDKIDKSTPSKKWINLTNHKQASILMQLHTGHIGLHKYLHCIKCTTSPKCPNCTKDVDKTSALPLVCTHYKHEWFLLHRALCQHSSELSYLLIHLAAMLPLLKHTQSTE